MSEAAAMGGAGAGLRFFLDRSLGSHVVPDALRGAGWVIETMDERYGSGESQALQDVRWIEEATLNGDVLLTKDLRVARNPLEATVVYQSGARVFALAKRDLSGPNMAEWFLGSGHLVFRMALRAAGPYVVAVRPGELRRVRLNRL